MSRIAGKVALVAGAGGIIINVNSQLAEVARPEARRATEALIPLGRLGQPDDLIGAVLFLASDESRWVTGSTVTVDGGYLAI